MNSEPDASASLESPSKVMSPPAFVRARSQRPSEHANEDHAEYDPNIKIEFVPPTEGTPAALALAANAAIKLSKFDKGLHKFRTLKRPKMKSLNIMKKLNKTTKQKRKKKHFSTNFKGKVIDGVHELYTLTAGMMLGIRYSVDQVMRLDAPNSSLKPEDYTFEENVPFPPKGNTSPPHITPPHTLAHTFEFKTYSPRIFKRLREFYDIDALSYMHSVCGDYNYLEFISNSKSGQFFFYSHDGKYMLKTQTKEENKFMRRILPQYYKYMTENPHSLLVRILGMHRIEMYHLRRKVHFVIMGSVFDSPVKINTIYDLKGSLIGRRVSAKERESGGVLKDQDLLDDHRKLHLGSKKAAFMAQLWKDVSFLATLKIMDYSLLVGIHDRTTRALQDTPLPSTIPSSLPHPHSRPPSQNIQTQSQDHSQPHPPATPDASNTEHQHHQRLQHSNTPFRRASIKGADLGVGNGIGAVPATDGEVGDGIVRRTTSRRNSDIAAASPSKGGEQKDLAPQSPAVHSADHSHTNYHPHSAEAVASEGEDEEGEEEEDDDDDDVDEDIDDGDSDVDDSGRVAAKGIASLNVAHANSVGSANGGSSGGAGFVRLFSTMTDHEGHAYGHGITTAKPWTSRDDGGLNSRVGSMRGKEIYYMGIIDILQEYNTSKRMETMVKGLTNDVRQISSVDPFRYARRFIEFMDANID